MKLDIKACALTFGLVWGVGLLILTWWLIAFEGATGEATWIGRFYLGYNVSAVGSLIGFGWAFTDGCFGGAIMAWLYNRLAKV